MIVNDSHVLFMHELLPLNLNMNMGNVTHFCFIKCSALKHSIVFLLLLAQFFKAITRKIHVTNIKSFALEYHFYAENPFEIIPSLTRDKK